MSTRTELLSRLAAFDTATVANAIELTGVAEPTEGFASLELPCLFPDLPPMVGVAVTCTHESTARNPRSSHLHDLIDMLAEAGATGPVVLVCQSVDATPKRGCLVGDMLATLLERLGGVGVVTDTGVRDLAAIRARAPRIQLFAPGCVAAHGRPSIVDVGATVTVGGLQIAPGDIVHGDANGVITVPDAALPQLAETAQAVIDSEAALIEVLALEPLPLEDLKARFFRHGYR